MSSPHRPAFFWFVLLACGVYAGFFVFAIYTTVRYHGLVKDDGWSIRHDARWSYRWRRARPDPADRTHARRQAPARARIVKIMDFGLAKVIDAGTGATESVSIAGTALGTIGYMAPEALTGGLVDERTHLFIVGVMAVETVTGTRSAGERRSNC